MVINLDALRSVSCSAVEYAFVNRKKILLVTQKDPTTEIPGQDDLYKTGTIATVRNFIRLKNEGIRVLVEGCGTAQIKNIVGDKPYISAEIIETVLSASTRITLKQKALIRNVSDLLEKYMQASRFIEPEQFVNICAMADSMEKFSYIVAANINLPFQEKQIILEAPTATKRLEKISKFLAKEIELILLEKKIAADTKDKIDRHQKEYFLREQIRTIYDELGESENNASDADIYRENILSLKLEEKTEEKLLKEVGRLAKMPSGSHEATVVRNYLDTVISLPWNKTTKETINLDKCRKILDKDHYGLTSVKERIIEYLAVKKQNPGGRSVILCLEGPPGVGKTSIASSVAKALNRKFVRISLGSIHDESDIRGHRKTYIGAMPGRIISAVSEAGVKNPLILLDEIDKMGTDYKGDPAAALLEVLDKEQNFAFRDHFIEVPFDLSEVMFVATANTLSTINHALLDRIEVVNLSSYTELEKEKIALNYLLPKQLKEHGVTKSMINIDVTAVREIIKYYVVEAGVRNLEREIANVIRKALVKLMDSNAKTLKITDKNLSDYLGKRKYIEQNDVDFDEPGVVNGLAYTSYGGTMLNVEVNVMPGSGDIKLTGKLGEVMKESAAAAISYVRANAKKLGIESEFYKNNDIHIHVPEGATPKDGPSAGITMASAIVSALLDKPVRKDIAMTGEITIRGRVLAIGGLKEKSLAAHRAKIYNIIIPEDNLRDIEDIPEEVRDDFNFIPVKNMQDVIKHLFTEKG
ncbi:MAG: endopeptidase La [Clostridia bacterium]|nr:endopeptidase La [Clostridia bacterium]